MIIAVAGKGGTGKSTTTALIIRHLLEKREMPVLAVDADPNSTLPEKLGVVADRAIGDLREEVLQNKYEVSDTPKVRTVEYGMQEALVEGNGFDLLVMGRGEGPGCYCSINNMLRSYLQKLSGSYKHVVIDNEAGMEHLSRQTNDKVDLLLIVCDQTPIGYKTAARLTELAKTMDVVRGRMGLVVNRTLSPCTREEALAATGLELLGCVPDDPGVREYEMQERSLLSLPADSPAAAAVSAIMDNAGG